MALNVDNEVQWLTTTILPEILKNGRLLDHYNESQLATFNVGDIKINIIGVEEAFMLTQCYRATINFEYAGENYQKKFVVKKTPPEIPPEAYDDAQFDDLFHNEIGFYKKILPIIQELSHGKFAAPKYYYSELKPYSAILILGDFGADGWSVTKNRVGLSLEHALIAVNYLGRFHGFGYALKHTQEQRFKDLASRFRESRYAKDIMHPEWGLTLKYGLKRVANVVSTYQPQVDEEFVHKLQQLTYSYVGYGRQRVAPREPLSTLCHGDYLRNNIAYKYENNNNSGEPVDIMMFDYQTMRHSSPMIDLSVYLAISTFADVRFKHFDEIFDEYCKALFQSYTRNSKQELPEFLNRENLLKEYIRFLPYSLSITSSFLPMLVEPPNITIAEMFTMQKSDEEIIQSALTLGGEIVDREIAHQVWEMFEFSRKHKVEIDEDIDSKDWANEVLFE